MEECLKREVKEETSLDVFDVRFIGVKEFIFGKEFLKKKKRII